MYFTNKEDEKKRKERKQSFLEIVADGLSDFLESLGSLFDGFGGDGGSSCGGDSGCGSSCGSD